MACNFRASPPRFRPLPSFAECTDGIIFRDRLPHWTRVVVARPWGVIERARGGPSGQYTSQPAAVYGGARVISDGGGGGSERPTDRSKAASAAAAAAAVVRFYTRGVLSRIRCVWFRASVGAFFAVFLLSLRRERPGARAFSGHSSSTFRSFLSARARATNGLSARRPSRSRHEIGVLTAQTTMMMMNDDDDYSKTCGPVMDRRNPVKLDELFAPLSAKSKECDNLLAVTEEESAADVAAAAADSNQPHSAEAAEDAKAAATCTTSLVNDINTRFSNDCTQTVGPYLDMADPTRKVSVRDLFKPLDNKSKEMHNLAEERDEDDSDGHPTAAAVVDEDGPSQQTQTCGPVMMDDPTAGDNCHTAKPNLERLFDQTPDKVPTTLFFRFLHVTDSSEFHLCRFVFSPSLHLATISPTSHSRSVLQ